MEGQLAFVKTKFSSLTEGIKCLQEKGATLEDSITLVKKKNISNDLEKVSRDNGKMVKRKKEKSKAIPATGRWDPQGCEMSNLRAGRTLPLLGRFLVPIPVRC
jgi:hypothetical protein